MFQAQQAEGRCPLPPLLPWARCAWPPSEPNPLFASEKTESVQKKFFPKNKTHFVGNCKEKRPLVLFDVFRLLCIEHRQRVQLSFGLINPLLPQVNLGA